MEKLTEKITVNEINAPAEFSEFQKRSWGILYFDKENPLNFGSNHAIVTDRSADLFLVAGEVKDFYLSKGLLPRIEFPLCDRLEQNRLETLKKAGFSVEIKDNLICMVKTSPSKELCQKPLLISEETDFDKGLVGTAINGGYENFLPGVLKKLARSENANFYVSRLFGDGVSLCTIERGKEISRLSNVLTGEGFRSTGFGSKTVCFAALKYEENFENPLYLLTENPLAQRLYRLAGFERTDFSKKLYTAVLEEKE